MSELTDKQTQLAALRKSRNSGVLTVRYGETLTTFRSLAEMEQIIRSLENEIAALLGVSRRGVRYIYQSGKGL
jgi:hypothetical protein